MRFGRRNYESRRRIRVWPLIVFGLFAVVYYNLNQETVPLTGRAQFVDVSMSQELALGISSYRQILRESDVLRNGSDVEFVKRVIDRLIPVVTERDFEWEVSVIRSEEANAFALPGGKIAVYTGILPIAKNEDGLATILGHEMAHAVARHGAERMTQNKLIQWGSLAASVSVGELEPQHQRLILAAIGAGTHFGMTLPFSRDHESEADYMGLIYMARACFNPEEAPKLWERMSSTGSRPPELLSTHPDPVSRSKRMKEWMKEALEVRSAHCE